MPVMQPRHELDVLVIDDEKNIRSTLKACLESLGCHVGVAATGEAARLELKRHAYQLAFLDVRLGDENGVQLMPQLHTLAPELEVVIITAYATIQTAVEAMQRGARDVLPKPFTPSQIERIVQRVVERRTLEHQVQGLRAQLDAAAPEIEIESSSARMGALLDTLGKAAQHDVPILINGENGTGKSVLARRIHALSARRERAFVVVNCPTLSEELLASELFGHAKGAFTGAVRDQPGRVESADGGTLFLDEIGEIPPTLQVKLLRFLQDKEFERIGESTTRRADVRIVAATNRDLEKAVQEGRFREDLLYRLNTFELTVPPLRERPEDLLPLARRFLAHFGRAAQRTLELAPDAEPVLLGYRWPGNIRELRNAMERAAILAHGQLIGREALPERIVAQYAGVPFLGGDFTLEQIEGEHLRRLVARAGTREEAARILGVDPSTLWRKLKRGE